MYYVSVSLIFPVANLNVCLIAFFQPAVSLHLFLNRYENLNFTILALFSSGFFPFVHFGEMGHLSYQLIVDLTKKATTIGQ